MKTQDELIDKEIQEAESTIDSLSSGRKIPFTVPESYFEGLERDFLSKFEAPASETEAKEETRVIKYQHKTRTFIFVAAAVACLLIAIVPIYKNISKEKVSTNKVCTTYESYVLNEVDETTMEDYIEETTNK